MPLAYGQGSGDFAETSGRIQAFHIGIRNSMGFLAPDGFTQSNPVTAPNPSTTLASVTTNGVLGCTVAFTRPDAGNGYIGGPLASPTAAEKPLGLFINDALGNAFENTPGVASGRAPYYSGQGAFGASLYETFNLNTAAVLTYAAGDVLVASLNGLLTNVDDADNAYEVAAGASASTILGIVKVAPDADNSLLVFDLRV